MAAIASTVDRLSNLPDEILVDIISRLATDEMVKTSVLSPRWRRLWTASPVLHFTGLSRPSPSPAILDRCLLLCSPATHNLNSVRFPLSTDPDALHRWILFAASRNVGYLTVSPADNFLPTNITITIPVSLFLCRSLSALRLCGTSIPSVPSPGFPHLRTIAFSQLSISDAMFHTLFTSCPGIQHLTLSHVWDITCIAVRAPALQHLMVYECADLIRVEIAHAPELRRLMYFGVLDALQLSQAAMPGLEEAAVFSSEVIAIVDPFFGVDLVESLAHVKVLSVNSWLFQFVSSLKPGFGGDGYRYHSTTAIWSFNNLRELHWWPALKKSFGSPAEPWDWFSHKYHGYLRVLFPFLIDCRSLEKLCIFLMREMDNGGLFHPEALDDSGDWSSYDDQNDPLNKYKGSWYTLPQLKTVSIAGFSGKKEEIRLVGFLTEQAAVLESISLHYVECMPPKLRKIRKVFQSIPKASQTVRISFTEFDEDKLCPNHETMWYDFMVL